MEQVIRTISKYIKVKDSGKLDELALNLWLVQNYKKPCVLLDFCRVQTKQFIIICKQILGENGLVLKLDQDYFLCNKSCLSAHLTSSLETPPVFLDITTRHPFKLVDSYPNSIRSYIENLQHCLGEKGSEYLEIQGNESEVNLCTIFGILLAYPVVYYFDTSQDITSLNNEDLLVVSLQYNASKVSSFSVPYSVYTESTAVQKSVQNWISNLCSCENHSDGELGGVIKICDKDFNIVKDIVNLPFVAL
jgi:hypothetical protein